jgi:hypothetical protein
VGVTIHGGRSAFSIFGHYYPSRGQNGDHSSGMDRGTKNGKAKDHSTALSFSKENRGYCAGLMTQIDMSTGRSTPIHLLQTPIAKNLLLHFACHLVTFFYSLSLHVVH